MLAGIGGTTPYKTLTSIGPGSNFGSYFFSGNSAFDPDVTATGGQPTGYDQWFGFYGRCTVLASKIKVDYVCESTNGHFKVGVVPVQTTSWDPTTDTPTDWPGSRSMTCGPISSGKSIVTVESFYRTSTMFGVSAKHVKDDEIYGQPFNNSPTNRWYWLLYAIPADATGGLGSLINAMVEITYYVKMSDRIELAIS